MVAEAVSAFLVDSLKKQLVSLVFKKAGDGVEGYIKRRRIERTIESCVLSTVESLEPYFEQEHISEAAQRVVVERCMATLQPLIDDSDKLLRGSLDPEKVFLLVHPKGALPKEVLDEGAGQVYMLVARQVCTLLCAMPGAIEGWEQAKWRDDYRRLDEIAADLKEITAKLDASARARTDGGDRLRANICQMQEQQSRLNLTGLRADRPVTCQFDKMFVNPALEYDAPKSQGSFYTREITGPEVVERLLAPRARSIVFGAPGAGKTTWCQWLRGAAVSGDVPRIGLLVRLRSLDWSAPPGLPKLLRDVAGPHLADEVTAEHFSQWKQQGAFVVLIDGFDEVAPAQRPAAQKWIDGLALVADRCPVVVTSRPIATGELTALGERWTHFELLAFDEPRIVRFIENWHTHAWPDDAGGAPIDAHALAAEWSKDPTIAPLTSNPLLLSTLLVVHKLDGRLPEGRAELYRRYVHGMIGIWAHEVATPGVTLNPEQKRSVLTGLALHMHLHEVDEIDEATALFIVRRSLDRLSSRDVSAVVLQMLCERTGLFVGPGSYGFTHKSIGEFLVAEAVVQGDRLDDEGRRIDRLRLREERFNDRWKTVLFLWAGLAPVRDVEDFFESISDPLTDADAAVLGGLLMDQGHRLSAERRAEFLRRLMALDFVPKQDFGMMGRGGVHVFSSGLRLFDLSGEFSDLCACFDRAIDRGDLRWQWPHEGVSEAASRSLWFSLGWNTNRASEAQLVRWATDEDDEQFEWAVSVAVGSYFDAGRDQGEILSLVRAFAAHRPHAATVGVLAIADRCSALPHGVERGMSLIHSLAKDIGVEMFPPRLLAGTRRAYIWTGDAHDPYAVDLFDDFESRLRALPETTLPEARATCLDLIAKLREARGPAPPPRSDDIPF